MLFLQKLIFYQNRFIQIQIDTLFYKTMHIKRELSDFPER